MNNENLVDKDLRDYVWNYFQMHASQRLTTFNFYIVISSVIATALFATFQQGYKFPYFGVFLGFLLSLLSFVFWKLDCRNKFLIKQAEEALKHFEIQFRLASPDDKSEPHVSQIFMREEYSTNIQRKKTYFLWKRHFSYSDCFNLVFVTFGASGLLAAIVLVTFR